MTRAARTLAAGTLVLLAASASRAAPSGDALLQRSEHAECAYSYRGVRVIRTFFRDQVVEAEAQVLHEKPATTRTEYLSPPSMAGTVILRIGADRWRRSGRNAPWQRLPAADEAEGINLLQRNYDLRIAQGSPVADRPCTLLLVLPRHPGNPSKRMWVDQATGLVLRTELLSRRHNSISSSAFREIEIAPDLTTQADLLQPPPRALAPAVTTPLGFKPGYPRYLPPGYVFSGTDVINVGNLPGAHLRYSDGLNTISLFQAPAEAFGGEQPFASWEWHFAQVITWRKGDMAYAAVGDIDPEQLRKMADSMGPAAPSRGR